MKFRITFRRRGKPVRGCSTTVSARDARDAEGKVRREVLGHGWIIRPDVRVVATLVR